MRTFIDERDAGSLILTHLYLLVGCAAPVWLYTPANPSEGTSGVPRSHLSLVWLITSVALW
jgi:dolichol kinase